MKESEIEERFQNNHLNSNHSDEMHANNQAVNYKEHHRSEAEELFLSEYADIQIEEITSMISRLEHLNLDHMNFES